MTFTKETAKKVWSDDDGTHIYIGPDADGFGCIDIRYVDEKGVPEERITLPKEQARLVAESILELLELDYLGLTKKS